MVALPRGGDVFADGDAQGLEISGDLLEVGLEVMLEVHPWTKVVNSVVVFKVSERGEA